MPKYVPILKAKAAECWAWGNAYPAVVQNAWPIFEVVPDFGLAANVFIDRIATMWPGGSALAVDVAAMCGRQGAGETGGPVFLVAEALDVRGVPSKPVMHLTDNAGILADVGAAARLHQMGACLRLGSAYNDPSDVEASAQLPVVLSATGLAINEIDLLLDFWAIESARDVSRAALVAGSVLQWAIQNGPWRSITVASGAFPQSISNLPQNDVSALPRHDADLYTALATKFSNTSLNFGDYVIWHPYLGPTAPRSPMPNLRYTHQQEWQVYRGHRQGVIGNASFYDLCDQLVHSSPYWPSQGSLYSEGDSEIYLRAQGQPGTGTATHWLRWAASHHLAHVVDRLTTLGVP